MKENKTFRINAKGDPEIMIYDDIGSGVFGGISSKDVAESIAKIPNTESINVRINSAGGDVFEGIAIYNALKRSSSYVMVNVDGMALSVASVIAMAGNEVSMADNAMMMVHNPWTVVAGDAAELRQMADTLEKTKSQIIKTYQYKTQLDTGAVSDLMDSETWMTSDEAVNAGFADYAAPAMSIAAKFDINRFRNVPKWAIDMVAKRPIRDNLLESCQGMRAFLRGE